MKKYLKRPLAVLLTIGLAMQSQMPAVFAQSADTGTAFSYVATPSDAEEPDDSDVATPTDAGDITDEQVIIDDRGLNRQDLSDSLVTVSGEQQLYTGSAIEPEITVTLNGERLIREVDYDLSYDNNIDVGTATAVVTGTGMYTGSCSVNFEIVRSPARVHQAALPAVTETDDVGDSDMDFTETGLRLRARRAGTDTELPPGPTPTDLHWVTDDLGGLAIAWHVPPEARAYYIEVFCNGEMMNRPEGIRWTRRDETGISFVNTYIKESGEYTFAIRLAGDGSTYSDSEWSETSAVYSYERPADVMPTPANARWDAQNPYIATWSPVDGALGYYLELWGDLGEGSSSAGWYYSGLRYDSETEVDLSQIMQRPGMYRFRVRAFSSDVKLIANSEFSSYSVPSYINPNADEIRTVIRNAVDSCMRGEKTATEVLAELTESYDKLSLAIAMQDEQVLMMIRELERLYREENDIFANYTVESSLIPFFSEYPVLDVIGLGLNGEPGRVITLFFEEPYHNFPVDSGLYRNAVKLSIETRPQTELKVPVAIEMLIPDGIEPEKFLILHYNSDGTCVEIRPEISDDRRFASFILTHFSDFALVEEGADDTVDISEAAVAVNGTYTYTGSAVIPRSEDVVVTLNGARLEPGVDYTTEYSNHTNAGTANVTIWGTGRYSNCKYGEFTIHKAPQSAPAAPVLSGKTAVGIILEPVSGAQYRCNSNGWQDSNVFTDLTPNTDYRFSVRLSGDVNHEPSPAGPALSVTTDPALLGGTVYIGGTAVFGETLAADTAFLSAEPGIRPEALNYQWERDGLRIPGATGSTYRLLLADIGCCISVTVTAGNCNGAVTSAATPPVAKAEGPAAPASFTLTAASVNNSSYTVTIPAVSDGEYSFDGINWSEDNTRTGCLPGTTVTGFVRIKAPSGHHAGLAASAEVTLPLFRVKKPVASPDGGDFTASMNVTLSCATDNALIYYTTDGSMPTAGSILYTGTITIRETTRIKAVAVKSGMTDSEPLSVTFTKHTYSGGSESDGSDSSSGGSSAGGSFADSWAVSPGAAADAPVNAVRSLAGTPDQDGKLTMAVTANVVKQGIAEAQKQWSGHENNGISITLANASPGTKSLTVVIERAVLDELVSREVRSVAVQCDRYRITLDEKAVKSLRAQSAGNVTVTVTPHQVSGSAAEVIGTRPVIDIRFVDSAGKEITNFETGVITGGIRYAAASDEEPDGLRIVKLTDANVQWFDHSRYENGWMVWSSSDCSVYGVGYRTAAGH